MNLAIWRYRDEDFYILFPFYSLNINQVIIKKKFRWIGKTMIVSCGTIMGYG